MSDDEKWMILAIKQAIKAEKEEEVPIGAVLVKEGLLIAKAHNQPITKEDATAHAEIQLLRAAGTKIQNYTDKKKLVSETRSLIMLKKI